MLEINPKDNVNFYFKSGELAKSISDLLLILIDMSDEEFLENAAPEKNKFAAWVEQVLLNPTLAQKIKPIQNKSLLIQALKENMKYRVSSQESLLNKPITPIIRPQLQTLQNPRYERTIQDFDLDSGNFIRLPSREKEVEAWEHQFFDTVERNMIPREYVKEFIYGSVFGFLTGLITGGVLYRVK